MSGQRGVRVGFALAPGDWLGGRNFLRNLIAAIHALPGNPMNPVLFMGARQADVSGDFPGVETVRTSLLDRKSPAWIARKILARTTSQDILLQNLLEHHNISVVSHSMHLDFTPGKNFSTKVIGWIPDFQHVHLPEFFTPEICAARERDFAWICERCDKVILSSESARADLRAVLPKYLEKTELLRFVGGPAQLAGDLSLQDLEKLYGFEGPYFLLPNQFWAHKNHRVVLAALQELKKQGKQFLVLATGSTNDSRNPSFFPSLMQYAEQCQVLDCFRVLGQIPYEHLVGLMRHTVAFINPSKFEGWSTSVEEAKSMGKQIVLSDLPVHREQDPERGFYFSAEDPNSLAGALMAALGEFDERRDLEMQHAAREMFPARQREFGETYRQIVEKTLG